MFRSILTRIFRPSTMTFLAEARATPGYSLRDFLHGYLYFRFPYLYISVGTGEHRLARWLEPLGSFFFPHSANGEDPSAPGSAARRAFADTYHAKVVPLETARQLVTIEKPIPRTDLEQVIPYARAREIILKNPDHIVVLDCPCRKARKNPCLPLDVCLIVGEPFASFTIDHHPGRARRITQAEAVEILRAEDERGHVHHAFFKDAALNRFYAICNCCSCCCGAMQAHHHGTPMLASSGFVNSIDQSICIACGECVELCQFDALAVVDGQTATDHEKCFGCGVCVHHCAHGAASLVRDGSKGVPLEVCGLVEGR
jgi:Pyruvate/2-oxoacid:ferredoxin oxidoreductase delta subunit